ncbi:MAG: cytochrome c oxidase assembly protein [Alphaproteobacteria bacterium]|nr:cytochrome c oxidase assembly protein [Alphaproteobacteria bacterium]
MTLLLPFWPFVILVVGLTLILWFCGAAQGRLIDGPVTISRHLFMVSALALLVLAVASPLTGLVTRSFALHQWQHLLIRIAVPMLLVLAWPGRVLLAGLPARARRRWLKPVLASAPLNRMVNMLLRLPVAFVLFVAALYVLQIPALHNAAVQNEVLRGFLHALLLLVGLIFWSAVLDRRDPPDGAFRPLRALALLLAIVSNILLGSLTTLKEVVLYPAYDLHPRLFSASAMSDEVIGGYTIWVPSSMIFIIGVLIVLHGWGKYEERQFKLRHVWNGTNSSALEHPQTAAELRLKVRSPNQATAVVLASVSLGIFIIVFATMTAIMTMF